MKRLNLSSGGLILIILSLAVLGCQRFENLTGRSAESPQNTEEENIQIDKKVEGIETEDEDEKIVELAEGETVNGFVLPADSEVTVRRKGKTPLFSEKLYSLYSFGQ